MILHIVILLSLAYLVIKKVIIPYQRMKYYQKQGVLFPDQYVPFFGHTLCLYDSWKKNGGNVFNEYFLRKLQNGSDATICGYLNGSVLVLLGVDPKVYQQLVTNYFLVAPYSLSSVEGALNKAFGWHTRGSDPERKMRSRKLYMQYFRQREVLQANHKRCLFEAIQEASPNLEEFTVDIFDFALRLINNDLVSHIFGKENKNVKVNTVLGGQTKEVALPYVTSELAEYFFGGRHAETKNIIFEEIFSKVWTTIEKEHYQNVANAKAVLKKLFNQKKDNPKDFLEVMFQTCESDPEKIVDDAFDFISTSSGISMSLQNELLFLVKNPQYIEKIRNETAKFIPENVTSLKEFIEKFDFQVQEEDNWVKSCCMETMRLVAPVHVSVFAVKHEPLVVDNIKILPEENVQVAISVLNEHPKYWQEPQSYRPERFFTGNSMSLTPKGEKRPPNAFSPFLPGPKSCIGADYAEYLVCLSSTLIVQAFDLSLFTDANGTDRMTFRPRHKF